jgi:hypothetical protein
MPHTSFILSRGLNAPAKITTTANNIASTATAAATVVDALVPSNGYQSDTSKVSLKISAVAGTVAAYAATLVPYGTVVAGVATVIAGVATLVGAIFKNSKAKKYAAERGQYETLLPQLIEENNQLDIQISTLYTAIEKAKESLGMKTNPVSGLGKSAKSEKKKLGRTKDLYNELMSDQNNKIKMLQELTNIAGKLFSTKSDQNTAYLLSGGILAISICIYIFKKVL